MIEPKEFFKKAKEVREKHKERVENRMLDRISYGAKETLKHFEKMEGRGWTTKEIYEDILKSEELKHEDS
jgi:hypothetical protein